MQVATQRVKANFGKAAATYDVRAEFQHIQTRRVLDAALMLLPEAATIADIGCGTGYFAHAASAQRTDWKILGLDIASGMCAVANTRCSAITSDATSLPFADASLDAVVSSLCYQWVENHRAAFSELARVLKPGGRAIIASLGEQSLQELRVCSAMAELSLSLLPMRDGEATATLLESCGFTITFGERRVTTEYYPNVAALLDSMRNIGAGNNFSRATHGPIRPKRWAAMVKHYEILRTAQGIPAMWEHHFFILRKIG